jgi:hypothetical protein
MFAILSPSPVFSMPLAKKKLITMSQMTSLVMADTAVLKGRVPVATVAVKPQKAQAPTGRGPSTKPMMVDRKMDSMAQACWVTPAESIWRY